MLNCTTLYYMFLLFSLNQVTNMVTVVSLPGLFSFFRSMEVVRVLANIS